MKIKSRLLLLAGALFFVTVTLVNAQPKPAKVVKHIVIIKEGVPANEIKEVDDSFQNLANKLNVVKG